MVPENEWRWEAEMGGNERSGEENFFQTGKIT